MRAAWLDAAYVASRWLRRLGIYGRMFQWRAERQARGRSDAARQQEQALADTLCAAMAGVDALAASVSRTVLILGWPDAKGIALQLPIVLGFLKAGYRPVVVLGSRAEKQAIRIYRAAGAKEFLFWTDLKPSPRTLSTADLVGLRSKQDVLAFEHDDLRVGRYAMSTMMRKTRRGRFDLTDERDRVLIAHWLQRGLDGAAYARQLLDRARPDAVVVSDSGYLPQGPLFELATRRGVAAFTWNAAHRNGAIILKRYGAHNLDDHPVSLSRESWAHLRAMPWTEADWDRVRDEITGCYVSGQWYGEVGTQVDKALLGREEVQGRLGLDPAKPTVLVFPHIFWDGTFFWGTDLFDDYETFFRECVRIAFDTPEANWIVKVHPANLVKNRRDGFSERSGELDVLDEMGTCPPHVHVLAADTDISTLSLYGAADVCVTVRGTVGIESACFGLATLTAGTGRYDRMGFTIDPETPEEFRTLLSRPGALPKPSPAQTELARRYADGILLRRPVRYEGIQFAYGKDALATIKVAVSASALVSALEVAAIAAYVASGRDDHLLADDTAQSVCTAEPSHCLPSSGVTVGADVAAQESPAQGRS